MPPPLPRSAQLGLGCRPMTDEDLPFVAELFASTRAEEVAMTGWPPEQQRTFLARQHEFQHRHYRAANPTGEWLIIEREGEPIGRLYLVERESSLHLIDVSLVAAARGAGLGTAILQDLIEAAGSAGRSMTMTVERNNRALRLYARLGFTLVEDQGVYLRLEWKPPATADQ